MAPQERQMRLFVAVDLPLEVRDALGRLQEALRELGLRDLRWVRPQGIHLTLKFLGETPAGQLPVIREAVAGAVRGAPPFGLVLGRPGTFGSRRGPQVLWVDLEGDVGHLRALQSAVERALAEVGVPRERREFSPHLTLARVRQPPAPAAADRLSRALEAVSSPRVAFEVREVVLMRSRLQPGGAEYERLAAFVLR